VPHYSRLCMVVIDVPEQDHDRELAFWRAATGQPLKQVGRYPEYHFGQLHGQEFWLLVQRLGEGAARVHVDIHTDDLDAEVARLEALGAQIVDQSHEWRVMRDPAGLLFCVVPDPPGALADGNAQGWD
jgi:catechol 2,3-dioxygenase-like lactoylglutathione lyase family enzyme